MDYFRLEFNEKQQAFHHDNYTHEPETNGWITIKDRCLHDFAYQFEAFLYAKKLERVTESDVLNALTEFDTFEENLLKINRHIAKINK